MKLALPRPDVKQVFEWKEEKWEELLDCDIPVRYVEEGYILGEMVILKEGDWILKDLKSDEYTVEKSLDDYEVITIESIRA